MSVRTRGVGVRVCRSRPRGVRVRARGVRVGIGLSRLRGVRPCESMGVGPGLVTAWPSESIGHGPSHITLKLGDVSG